MKLIERIIRSTIVANTAKPHASQASINSDGVIVLRNYNTEKPEEDEIVILSREETNAIFKLFSELKRRKAEELPF